MFTEPLVDKALSIKCVEYSQTSHGVGRNLLFLQKLQKCWHCAVTGNRFIASAFLVEMSLLMKVVISGCVHSLSLLCTAL